MVILVDTNIILDMVIDRDPFAENARKIIEKCASREVAGYIAAHSIPNLFYILRKNFNLEERKLFLKELCAIFRISSLDEKKILSALENDRFRDFEDCLQEECATEIIADYIVTRNPKDYEESRVKVIQPQEFLALFDS